MWESAVRAAMQSPTPASPLTQSRSDTLQEAVMADEGDFATEAAYSRPGSLRRPTSGEVDHEKDGISKSTRSAGPRGSAPVIGEKHVWGVVDEWGAKAGKWGKGAKAFGNK
jgi:hypothetical protein